MKKNSGKQAVINFIGQHPGCSFQDIRRGTGLDSSVVNSSLWQMHRDGQVKREGECRSYRYTLIDTTAVTESDPSVQYRQRPGGSKKMKNEIEQIAQQNDMSIEFVTWFFNEKKVGCGNVWFMMMAAMWEGWKGRSIEMDKLAAENVALKQAAEFATAPDMWVEQADGMLDYRYHEWYVDVLKAAMETPATDAYLAGIKADGVEEFAAYQRAITEEWACKEGHSSLLKVAESAEIFAKQLREGAK
ncbi:TPA: hypothetical protein ACPURI_001798 [Klebsiella pneumoniae]